MLKLVKFPAMYLNQLFKKTFLLYLTFSIFSLVPQFELLNFQFLFFIHLKGLILFIKYYHIISFFMLDMSLVRILELLNLLNLLSSRLIFL